MNTENAEGRLWDYIDGVSSAGERTVIEQLLSANAEWQSKYRELLDIHQLMQSSELEEPSLRFTKNVMDEIARLQISPAAKAYINKNVIRGIFVFFLALIVGFMVYGFGQLQLDWSSGGNGNSVIPFDLTKIDYSKLFNNTYVNVFMLINIILGLFLMDRYLASKRNRFHKEG